MEKLVEGYNNERKNIRKFMTDILIASKGAYSLHELLDMPLSHVTEIQEFIIEQRDRETEAIKKSQGVVTRKF